jgi:hypothetical protein
MPHADGRTDGRMDMTIRGACREYMKALKKRRQFIECGAVSFETTRM